MRPPSQTHDLSDLAPAPGAVAPVPSELPVGVAPRPRAVTQKQIAERVGVTQQLVALALKDSPNVAIATRDKIRAAARELGYNPNANHHARSLAAARHGTSVRSNVIAVVFEMTTAVSAMGTPYFMPLMDGIEIEAGERQLDLLLVRRSSTGLPWLLRDGWVDGVILLGSHTSAGELGQLGIPVVTLGAYLPDFPGITPHDEAGTYDATQYLLSLGHRNIAYLGPTPDWPSSKSRVLGYHRALAEAGIAVEEMLEERDLPEALEPDGTAGMLRLLERAKTQKTAFTALVCHNDSIAMAAIRVARGHGLRVPEDLSVTGFDDISPSTGFSPLITSVGFSSLDMGRSAVKMLMSPSPDALPGVPQHDEFPVSLRVRESTGPIAN